MLHQNKHEREMGKTSINEQDQEGKRMNGIPHLFCSPLVQTKNKGLPESINKGNNNTNTK